MVKGKNKERIGVVVQDKMDKTVVVQIEWRQRHPLYKKQVRRQTKFYAHDPQGQSKSGDTVRIVEIRPMSKIKRWLVTEVVSREALGELKPSEIDRELVEGTKPLVTQGDAVAQEDIKSELEGESEASQVKEGGSS